ncbi:MAG: FCD domain-containing protein, partial [Faecousia sp.]
EAHPDSTSRCSGYPAPPYVECPAMEILAYHHTDQDITTLKELCHRAALAAEGKTEISFAEALYQYHRTLMKLSGNTITPLVINALVSTSLPFWSDYEQLAGPDAALERLEQFTKLIETGEGEKAAQLLRDGIEDYKKERGYDSDSLGQHRKPGRKE